MEDFFSERPTKSRNSTLYQQPQPWVEKYRPKSIDDVTAQEQTVAVLKKSLESKNLPHMLFYGPPGTGKTSTILALARELYEPEILRDRILELNASDERGINVVREKIKNFARVIVGNRGESKYPNPPYKIIILDEADQMTNDAQTALRRTMETYSRVTRFCLICNYVSRIIEPLASRCAKFRFKPLDIENTKERLQMICEQERIKYEPEALDQLISASEGDLRKAIMYLQSAYRLHKNELITRSSILEIAGTIPANIIDNLLGQAYNLSYTGIESAVKEIVKSGYSSNQVLLQVNVGSLSGFLQRKSLIDQEQTKMVNVLTQIQEKIIYEERLTDIQKSTISQHISEVDNNLNDGSDEHLQILALILNIMRAL
ncbi:11182_t:CDS:2 [Ambispora gerdemannii]|uniref:11182_t:CDS:1 n=1 Tax=Ambispora gerdemannii TaxID=144530 RepID=A0A9N8WEC6_9GLOM|nr:11182_t:CDS:2 [Ambispora gerdemannii]